MCQFKKYGFFAAVVKGDPIGFVAARENNSSTAEIYVMGILRKFHRLGIGTRMLNSVEDNYRARKFSFLEVKTLDEARESEEYSRTRKFYEKCGFFPLETLTEIWGKENPCLIMVKNIKKTD